MADEIIFYTVHAKENPDYFQSGGKNNTGLFNTLQGAKSMIKRLEKHRKDNHEHAKRIWAMCPTRFNSMEELHQRHPQLQHGDFWIQKWKLLPEGRING